MVRNSAAIVNELSKIYTLYPGDIIFTGTPEGVGPVESGDKIEASIAELKPLSCSII
jgi:fumarylpyruvate hydrolase